MTMDSEIERMRAMRNPPIKGSSVPGGAVAAQNYAQRLQTRYYRDQEKMQRAMVRLNALAEACGEPVLRRSLFEVAEALR